MAGRTTRDCTPPRCCRRRRRCRTGWRRCRWAGGRCCLALLAGAAGGPGPVLLGQAGAWWPCRCWPLGGCLLGEAGTLVGRQTLGSQRHTWPCCSREAAGQGRLQAADESVPGPAGQLRARGAQGRGHPGDEPGRPEHRHAHQCGAAGQPRLRLRLPAGGRAAVPCSSRRCSVQGGRAPGSGGCGCQASRCLLLQGLTAVSEDPDLYRARPRSAAGAGDYGGWLLWVHAVCWQELRTSLPWLPASAEADAAAACTAARLQAGPASRTTLSTGCPAGRPCQQAPAAGSALRSARLRATTRPAGCTTCAM
jgi:hypothetical protein